VVRYSGLGTTRAVVVIGRVALKIARNERGVRCNRYEADLYARTTPERRAMLCPVLWCSENGAILAMRAACPITQAEASQLLATEQYPDWDYSPFDRDPIPFEYKFSDWGRLDGKLVAVDYSEPALTTPEELAELLAEHLRRQR